MDLLVINWQDIKNPWAGGAEIYLFEIFSRLASKGDRVTLFCSQFWGAERREVVEGLEVLRAGRRNTFNFTVMARLGSILRDRRFDLVVEDLNKLPFYTPAWTRLPTAVLVMHLFRGAVFKETNPILGSYVYLAESLIPLVYKGVDFAVLSKSTADDLLRMGVRARRIEVIPPGVDTDSYRPDPARKGERMLLHLGRLKRYKCVDHLLRALTLLPEDLRLVIAGTGDDLPRLWELAHSLKLQDRVEFKGFVSEAEKIRLYQAAQIVVETSVKEGWGLTVMEANACGTPVVAADSPGLRDSLLDNETGLLYRFGEIPDLAQKIRVLLDDPARCEAMGQAGRKWAVRFTWDGAAERMGEFLKGCIR